MSATIISMSGYRSRRFDRDRHSVVAEVDRISTSAAAIVAAWTRDPDDGEVDGISAVVARAVDGALAALDGHRHELSAGDWRLINRHLTMLDDAARDLQPYLSPDMGWQP